MSRRGLSNRAPVQVPQKNYQSNVSNTNYPNSLNSSSPINATNGYYKKNNQFQKGQTRHNSKDYTHKKIKSLQTINIKACTPLAPEKSTPSIKVDLENYSPNTIQLSNYFNLFYVDLDKQNIPSKNAAEILIETCSDITSQVDPRSSISNCCFPSKVGSSFTYQTAQIVGLGIRLREIL